ncbi:MAG: prolipoprotein diacylglyceryl transferase [Planctomycetes bacterium]|nr:prolipoprotein diacylglyceryl transferase [Planctomycetota bacterium]
MLGVLTHPQLIHDWFTTTLLRWSHGLVIYDQWLISGDGITAYEHASGGEVLLDFYYLCYLIAFIGVLFFFNRYRKQGWLKIKPHVPYDVLLLTMIGVLVGAKTAYIFIYNPDFYFGDPPYGPVNAEDMLRRIFLNWSGMASHGAAFGVLTMALLWWLKGRPKIPIAHIGDIGGISAAFGAIWIRLANFMNAELYGRAASADLPWAMRFPVRSGKGNPVVFRDGTLWERMPKPEDPAQVEAWLKALHESNPGGVIEQTDTVLFRNPDAYLQGYELAAHTADGLKIVDPPPANAIHIGDPFTVVTTPRHPSQLYQMLLEGLVVFVVLILLRKRVKRAGMIAAAFWILYPLARFIGEFWRQPDVQFQEQGNTLGTVFLGLSMGQVLSLVMASFGAALMLYFWRKGRIIADQKMWPPDKDETAPAEDKPKVLTVPFEKGMGGSTGAGEIAGLSDLRAALTEQEKQWDRDSEQGIQREAQETENDPDDDKPAKPERGD